MPKPKTIFFLIILILPLALKGQFIINEFSASNSSLIADPDYDNYADWLEIYNVSESHENLNGYYITDNLENLDKYQIVFDTVIPPGGFILLWMDDIGDSLHVSFKLAQEGESIGIVDPEGTLIDSLTYPAQVVDITMGRIEPEGNDWVFFTNATPGTENNSEHYAGVLFSVPEFPLLGGLFDGAQKVEIRSLLGGTIRYTTDGSEPTELSEEYQAPINIDSTLVLRARIFRDGYIPGKIITHTYFVDEGFENRGLPVISIATNPENFWDSEQGIYVQDFKPDWEVPINIELFENNGSDRALFNSPAGVKVNGLYSWQLPQKMLGVYFRKKYGENDLETQLFLEKPRTNIENFALRASGSDWSYTLFRDVLGQSAVVDDTDIDYMAYRACCVYVNGEYLGIHNIREKVNKDYIVGNYGLEAGTFDLIENENFIEEGSIGAYNEFKTKVNKDLSIQENFDSAAEYIDIDNFTEMVITQLATRNTSIDHNIMCWKPKDGGKWRWILMDLDRGFFNPTSYGIDFLMDRDVLPFNDLMENDGYQQYFGQKLADHLYVTFSPTRMLQLIDSHTNTIENEINNHIERWLGTTSTYGDALPSVEYWRDAIDDVRDFVVARPAHLLNDLTDFGFEESTLLNLNVVPARAGSIQMNGLDVHGSISEGYYPKSLPISFKAINRPGYEFKGWVNQEHEIISTGEEWKYNDTGTNLDSEWITKDYDDTDWESGNAELGYGDNDEQTVLSYGLSASDKRPTYYFRKSFELSEKELSTTTYFLRIKRDDGAIVYVNGQEVVRTNMPQGNVNYYSKASSSVGGSDEDVFYYYEVPVAQFELGNNLIAVEVHQYDVTSSDISFDLQLYALLPDEFTPISTADTITVTLSKETNLTALFEETGECMVPDTIHQNTILSVDCSPYYVRENVFIPKGVELSIEPGVEIYIPKNGHFYIQGKLEALGTATDPIRFKANPKYGQNPWGALNFIQAQDTSILHHVVIEGASHGSKSIHADAAISSFASNLKLDHISITNVESNPITARYSYVSLKNSDLHSKVTGDLINVKYGKAFISDCIFRGNDKPDTDAIDYDDIEDGKIVNCKIYNFFGPNSDAIDIGERATNIQIDSVFIYNVSDKGISVGQHSSARVSHSTFVNCNQGFGLKDSCSVQISHCTFYNTATPIVCFEKNIGHAGGNATVNNSILSNSTMQSYFCDDKSTISIINSISDNNILPEGGNNLFADPSFVNPTDHNFSLKDENYFNSELGSVPGSYFHKLKGERDIIISGIYYNNLGIFDQTEFIMLYNPDTTEIDLSGYSLSNAIVGLVPDSTTIGPKDVVYIVRDKTNPPEEYYSRTVVEWEDGRLNNNGDKILLHNSYGIVIDAVDYNPSGEWPEVTNEEMIELVSADLDNHFGKNWTIRKYYEPLDPNPETLSQELLVYPNPAKDYINIEFAANPGATVLLYNLAGIVLKYGQLNEFGYGRIDAQDIHRGIYIVKVSNASMKIAVF